MKTIFRFLSLGVVFSALCAFAVTAGYAQQPEQCADADGQAAIYTKFTDTYAKKTLPEMEAALAAGKEFLEKYGACEALKEQIDFVKPQVARLEKAIPVEQERIWLSERYKRFDAGITSDNADEIYAAGKEILSKKPDNLNIIVPMGIAGLHKSYNKDNKYADESIRYAQMAINELKAGKSCNKKNKATGADVCGALKFEFPQADTVSELTYAIAYLKFYAKGDKKGALPIYYEISQTPGKYKDEPRIYATIGSHFASELPRLAAEVGKLIEKQKPLSDEEKIKMEPEIKAAIALLNGYAERAMDGFVRAYSIAKSTTPAEKAYKDSIYKDLTVLYKGRFDKTDGIDSYIATVVAKPMPNPLSEVQPISDPDPVTTTTTTTTGPGTGVGAANGSGVGAANGSGVGAANGSGLGKPSGAGVSGAKAATPANGSKPAQAQSKPGTTATTKPRK